MQDFIFQLILLYNFEVKVIQLYNKMNYIKIKIQYNNIDIFLKLSTLDMYI